MQLFLAIVFHAIILLVAAWDLYVAFAGRPEDTVTLIVRGWTNGHPILAFLMGMTIGHLLWSTCPLPADKIKIIDDDLAVRCQVK